MTASTDLDALYTEWRGWLDQGPIYGDVMHGLQVIREVWRGYEELVKGAPAEAKANGTFHTWVRYNYERTLGVTIRRQADIRTDVVSLGRLLDLLCRFP